MQKVEGSSPFIRLAKRPGNPAFPLPQPTRCAAAPRRTTNWRYEVAVRRDAAVGAGVVVREQRGVQKTQEYPAPLNSWATLFDLVERSRRCERGLVKAGPPTSSATP
jgi:hypothetical protein